MKKLMIPICIEAFLSNGKTSDDKRVPQAAPDYSKVSYTSLLGSRNTPGDFQTAGVLRAGVHLHFILPDALTHAGEEGYPAVPNRYIVTRFFTDSRKKKISAKVFLVESDFMSTDRKYSNSVTIPRFQEKDLRKNWRYLGRSYEIEGRPEKEEGDEYLEKLTAVGAGDPMFAAYYPSCSSVFGFYDDLEGVEQNTSLTYFVTGYYSDATMDGFYGIKSEEAFIKALEERSLSVEHPEEVCGSSVLFGEVTGVLWRGTEAEYGTAPVGEIKIAMGNTSVEALSAAVVELAELSGEEERILTALQYELADSSLFVDGNYKMDDEIHLRQFQRVSEEESDYRLVFGKEEEDENSAALGKLFSDFCLTNRKAAGLKRMLLAKQKKLFHSWEQYMLCYEDPRTTPQGVPSKAEMLETILKICTEEINELEGRIAEAENDAEEYRQELMKLLGTEAELTETAAQPFYVPKDPVILLSGPGIKRAYAFGEDGRFSAEGVLNCQTEPMKTNIVQDALFDCLSDKAFIQKLPCEWAAMLAQALLLSEDCLPVIEADLGSVIIEENAPSEIAKNKYHEEPITLFLSWEARYLPTCSRTIPDTTLKDWEFHEEETTYHYTGALSPSQLEKTFISGKTILTPHAVLHLSQTLKNWLDKHSDDPELIKAAEKIKNLGVISQNMDGFTKAFLSMKESYEFPIMGAGGDESVAYAVSQKVPAERTSILPGGMLRHLRGGMLGIQKLSLVGTFGQVQRVADSSYYGETKITFSETLEKADGEYALMPPAFHEPVRLNSDFVSAKDDSILSSEAAETSPVYGIVLPELLNGRLMIYESSGTFIGSINKAYRQGKTTARWVSAEHPEQSFEETTISDERLRAFIEGILTVEAALTDLLKLMDSFYEKKLIPGTERLVWGRPFVLARCSLKFEFYGMPECVKDMASFGQDNTLKAENISFPVLFGAMGRAADGVLGCFDDEYGGLGFVPVFGSQVEGAGKYFLPQEQIEICAAMEEKNLTIMFSPHADITVQTGLLPIQTMKLAASHAGAADEILTAAEMNPVLASDTDIALPLEAYEWRYREEDVYIRKKILPPMTDFAKTVIMDGFMVKKEEKDE